MLAGVATVAQIALADPPLEWPTDPSWLAEPRNLFALCTGLLTGLGAIAAAAQIFAPAGATWKQVRELAKGVAHTSGQIRAEGFEAEARDAETHRKLSALPAEVSARLLPELRKIAEANPTSQLKDVEVTISIKASFFNISGDVDTGSTDSSAENDCGN